MTTDPDKEVFEFNGFLLDPARRALTKEGGSSVSINAKAFDALLFLLERAGTVVERTELSSALWPHSVVEDNNLSQTIAAVRRALGDAEQRLIATVPRRGYQFTAPVVRRSGAPVSVPTLPVLRAGRKRWVVFALPVITALALGTMFWTSNFLRPESQTAAAPRSIAVLPFENLSPDPEDAYFAAGMHEDLLTRLAQLDDVRVIGRTSMLRYAHERPQSLSAIAAELNVATVVEGSVRQAGDRVRVNARLVEGATGAQLWAETYDASLSDVFGIQMDIATRIATALNARLTSAARERLATPPTSSMTAYSAYLKALELYRSSGAIGVSMPPELRHSIRQYLDQALQADPRFAAALGWRAQVNVDSLQFDSFESTQRAARIDALAAAVARDARDALALDRTLGVAYAALSRLHFFEYRLDEALAALDEARKLAPGDSALWQAAAVLHYIRDEGDAAIIAARRAIELDPRNPGPYSLLGMGLRTTGHHDEAVEALSRMIELAPTAGIGYVGLARLLTSEGDTPRMRETLRIAEELLGNTRNFRLDLALSYASIGADADAQRLIEEFRHSMQGNYIDPALEAMALLASRDHQSAHAVLSWAITEGRNGMDQVPLTLIRYNSWNDPVLDSPHWIELRERLAFKAR